MSLEISQAAIDEAYATLSLERDRDWTLVAGVLIEAEVEKKPTDGALAEELADMRWRQALGYNYPVPDTGPTRRSSLRTVRDIMKIRELVATANERQAMVELQSADTVLINAENLERGHRLWEKGVLRIFDQRTNSSMWSVEWDRHHPVSDFPPEERVGVMVDRLVLRNRER